MADQKFDILPDVTAENRDLLFAPVNNLTPAAITTEQIDHFNKQGYVAPIQIFEEIEIDDLRAYFDNLLERTLAAGGTSYSISSAHLEYGRV